MNLKIKKKKKDDYCSVFWNQYFGRLNGEKGDIFYNIEKLEVRIIKC